MTDSNQQTILILGGNGFIGTHLTRLLIDSGYNIIIFDQYPALKKNPRVIYFQGDFNNRVFVEEIFKRHNIDIVFHLICTLVPGTPKEQAADEARGNIVATMNLLDLMKNHKINKIIFQSSGGVIYGQNGKAVNCETDSLNPINYYGWTKLAIEKYVELYHRLFGLEYLILRPSNIYGPGQKSTGLQGLIPTVLSHIVSHQPIEIWGDGTVVRDYLFIDDFCQAVSALLQKSNWNDIYNVGNGQGHSVNDIIYSIKQAIKIDFEIRHFEGRLVDIPVNVLDIVKLKNNTGWYPKISIEDGLIKTWEKLNR